LSKVDHDSKRAPLVVAYEPQWAIGGEKPASAEHTREVCASLQMVVRPADSVIYGGSAGPGLLERLGDSIDGLFLGRYVHDPTAFEAVLDEAGRMSRRKAGD
jgi:triosephosphate isomerase